MVTIAQLEAQVEILSRRLEEVEREKDKAERLAQKNEVRAMQAEGAAERAAIESHLRIAALEAGSTQEPTSGSSEGPLDTVVRRAMIDEKWGIDSHGKIFRVGADGKPVMTAGGYDAPASVMKKIRETLPGAFPKHQAAGTAGNGTSIPAGAGPNPWSAAAWNQTHQSEYEATHGTAAADAMAKAAGSSLYATHPPKGA